MPANAADPYDWNNAPPRGHPMEGSDDFPGPLYPPDAAPGKTPSKDSPFVVAVKRACAHLGAWPWDPPSWDDSYSNTFAHGHETNPTKAGVAAVQRWAGTMDDTGWVGVKTYNFLRSVLIPQNRTHAGEPAWDQVCVNLTAEAYELAYPPAPETLIREQALKLAIADIGYVEGGSNDNKYGVAYGENNVAYCAIAVTIWHLDAGSPVGASFQTVKQAGSNDRHDFVPYVVSDARNGRYGFSITTDPQPGNIVAYNWGGYAGADSYQFDHVGLFEQWVGGHTFLACEANTSPDNGGSQSNGGGTWRRTRDVNGQGTVFIRVKEPG